MGRIVGWPPSKRTPQVGKQGGLCLPDRRGSTGRQSMSARLTAEAYS